MAFDPDVVLLSETDESVDVDDAPVEPGDEERSWRWHAIRVSGIFLAIGLPLHVVVTFIRNDIGVTTAVTMTERWHHSTWRPLEWVVLVLALVHGWLAASHAIDNGSLRRGWRTVLGLGLSAVVFSGIGAVTFVMFTYDFP